MLKNWLFQINWKKQFLYTDNNTNKIQLETPFFKHNLKSYIQ